MIILYSITKIYEVATLYLLEIEELDLFIGAELSTPFSSIWDINEYFIEGCLKAQAMSVLRREPYMQEEDFKALEKEIIMVEDITDKKDKSC